MRFDTLFRPKVCVVLHFLVGPGVLRLSITLSFPKGILAILRKSDFLGNRELFPSVCQVLDFRIFRNSKMETWEDCTFAPPEFHHFSPMAVFPRF